MSSLTLFFTFFKIGLFTIGGGYAMLPLIRTEIVNYLGLMTETELIDFIGVAESTPGVFSVNLATFIGNSQFGILGALCATLGLILPSIIIILLVALLFQKFLSSAPVQGFLFGVQPVVIGLIASATLTVLIGVIMPLVNLSNLGDSDFSSFEYVSFILTIFFLILGNIKFKRKNGKKKTLHPIALIGISAAFGVIIFAII